jgi:UDP-3-O-[3-hydroxymyristoyl] glucosamine N-acyltransferase
LSSAKEALIIASISLKKFFEGTASVSEKKCILWVENPRLVFCRILERFFPETSGTPSIHSTAVVHQSAKVPTSCHIGPYCVIEENVELGEGCVLRSHVILQRRTILGSRVLIHPGTVIGADGFGYERSPDGTLQKFTHYGRVVIGDDVEIGANSTVDRGTLGDTVIGRGTKIDNLTHIAHNAEVGNDCLIIAGSVLCGSVQIRDRVWISPHAHVKQGIIVGEDSMLGLGASVTSDVPPKTSIVGWPGHPVSQALKILRFLKRQIHSRID